LSRLTADAATQVNNSAKTVPNRLIALAVANRV
jgi:hypothetical protein